MFIKSLVATVLLATSISAQTGGSSANSTIDANTVDLTLRSQWCSAQLNTCGTLCSGDAQPNICDENALTFNCTCSSNSSAPGLQYYTGTLPTFICEYNFQQCITKNANIKASQDKCIADEKANCGHLDPSKFVPPTSSSSSSSAGPTPSRTSGGDANAATTSASSSSSSGAAATMLAVGGEYGAGMVAAGVAAAFGLML